MATPASRNPFRDKNYYQWLVKQIRVPVEARELDTVFSIMFDTEFVWLIGNDENRIADGRDLRVEYLNRKHIDGDVDSEPISFLEVLIGLSRRIAFLVERKPEFEAWRLVKNLKLGGFRDPLDSREVAKVKQTLERVIWRGYRPDGSGGFFPLTNPQNDQSKAEIWSQMNAYIQENRVSFGL